MEDVGAIFVDLNTFDFFSEDIACNVLALFYDEAFLSVFCSFMRKHSTEKPCADNQIVILSQLCLPLMKNSVALREFRDSRNWNGAFFKKKLNVASPF